MNAERFVSLAVALGIGFLIGLQREQSAATQEGGSRSLLGGVRTYPLVALVGALSVLLANRFGSWILAVAFAAILIPLALAYADDLRQGRDRGITSEVALLITFLLGSLSSTSRR